MNLPDFKAFSDVQLRNWWGAHRFGAGHPEIVGKRETVDEALDIVETLACIAMAALCARSVPSYVEHVESYLTMLPEDIREALPAPI